MKCILKWFCIILFSPLMAVSMRQWEDNQGRKISASIHKIEADSVYFRLQNGTITPFPKHKLSLSDQAFLKEYESKNTLVNTGNEVNFDDPWPEKITYTEDPSITVELEDPQQKKFIYSSANYRFQTNARLAQSVVKNFAVMFEASRLFCQTVPLGFDEGERVDGKYQIKLYELANQYFNAGGPANSAGVFMPREKVFMSSFDFLGLKAVGKGYMLDREKDNTTLVHELSHQLTPHVYLEHAGIWFIEGIAEYFGHTPYKNGVFYITQIERDLVAYVTAYGPDNKRGRNIGKDFSAPSLKKFMSLSHEDFMSGNTNFNYGFAALLVYYFVHWDGNKDAQRLKNYLKVLRSGKSNQEAILLLLDGRTYEQLEADVAKAWKSNQVKIEFPN